MDSLSLGTLRITDKSIKDAPYDKTFTARVTAYSANNGHTVKLNGEEYTFVMSLNATVYSVNDTVLVTIPNGQYNNMFILGKLG